MDAAKAGVADMPNSEELGEAADMLGGLGSSRAPEGGPGGRIPTTGYDIGVGDGVATREPRSTKAAAPWELPV